MGLKARSTRVTARSGTFIFNVFGAFILTGALLLAWNYQHSTVAVLASGLLLVWGASYLWTAFALHKVSTGEHMAMSQVFAGEMVPVHLSIKNEKWFPVAWLRLERPFIPHLELIDSPFSPTADNGLACRLSWLFWHQEASWDYHITPYRRGIFRLGPITQTSGDPFGFFHSTAPLPDNSDLVVFPPVIALGLAAPSWSDPLGEKRARDFLHHDPLAVAGIRDYLPGDPLRQINWTATVKFNRLQTNQLEGSVSARTILVIGGLEPLSTDRPARRTELAFELLMAGAASVALVLARQRVEVGLLHAYTISGCMDRKTFLQPESGKKETHLREILTRLALMTTQPGENLASFLRRNPLPPRTRLIVFNFTLDDDGFQQWLEIARGRPVDFLVLESENVIPRRNVHQLFPGWRNNPVLTKQVLGPGWKEDEEGC